MARTRWLILVEGKVVMAGIVIGIERGKTDRLASVHDYQRLLFNSLKDHYAQSQRMLNKIMD
jgi:hypothetical protein